ncbi:hypothetical protein [Pyrobaculum aerophilum]|uniref:hypothetical protein n=1 Tax=Pyrobaculum aerophilum TaxID=13773 RepID=UPI0021618FBD|nr:hypothetical protein [Pyrobaculum aerophilum]
MLKELIPVDVKCVEPSPFFKQLSPVPVIDGVPQGVNAVISFGSSHREFLKMALEKLKSGGVLIVSDEFIDDYASEGARRRNVIKHHLGYLLDIPLVSYRDELLSAYNASYKNLALSLRILSRVYYEVYERVKTELYTTDVEMAFLNFYFLELTAMLLGVAYIEERKTSVERFISEASEVGLRLTIRSTPRAGGRPEPAPTCLFLSRHEAFRGFRNGRRYCDLGQCVHTRHMVRATVTCLCIFQSVCASPRSSVSTSRRARPLLSSSRASISTPPICRATALSSRLYRPPVHIAPLHLGRERRHYYAVAVGLPPRLVDEGDPPHPLD